MGKVLLQGKIKGEGVLTAVYRELSIVEAL